MTKEKGHHDFSRARACALQLALSKRLVLEDVFDGDMKTVGGVDVAYTDTCSIGAAVVLDYETLQLREASATVCKTVLPYMPTFLSFRETSPMVAAIRRLRHKPDIWLVDGQGYAHPRRLGLASHLGLVLKTPTIGVAKNLLCGKLEQTPSSENHVSLIRDGDEVIGAAVLTPRSRKPVFVSVGHMVSLATALRIVKHCSQEERVPVPIRAAHTLALTERQKLKRGNSRYIETA